MANITSPVTQGNNYTSRLANTEENLTEMMISSFSNRSNPVFDIIAQVEMYSDLIIVPTGVFVNCLCILIFVKSKMAFTAVGLHLIYLAIADNLVLMSGFIGSTRDWHMLSNIRDICSSNIITCIGAYMSINVGFTWSGVLLASSTIERFLSIAFPFQVKSWNFYRKSKILMGVYPILSLLLCGYGVLCVEIISVDGTNICLPSRKYEDVCYVGDMIVIGAFANGLCFTTILIFTILTSISLYKYKQRRADLRTVKNTGREIHMTLMLLVVAALFVILRSGDIITYFLSVYSEYQKLSETIIDMSNGIFPVFILLSNINHSINFIVYVIFLGDFRKTFVGIFSYCRRSTD